MATAYDRPAKLLHWAMAGLLAVQFAVSWTMPDVHRGTKSEGLIAWHVGIGTFLLLLVLLRAGWRMRHAVPPPPDGLPAAMRLAARAVHGLLYLCLFVVPLLGWTNADARGWPIALAGIVPLPALVPEGSPFGRGMGDVHQVVAYVLLGLAGAHVAGALYHRFVLRDGVFGRMAFRGPATHG